MPVRRRPIALLAAALLAPGAVAHAQYQDGTISTVAGGFSAPSDVAFIEGGSFVVADTGNDRIRRVDPDGTVTTDVDGLNGPQGVTAWPGGGYLIADTQEIKTTWHPVGV